MDAQDHRTLNDFKGRSSDRRAFNQRRSVRRPRRAKVLLTETTRYTNSQNAVGEKDFIALEADFRTWTPAFSKKLGVFLEIQRGAWEARWAYQKQNPCGVSHTTNLAFLK